MSICRPEMVQSLWRSTLGSSELESFSMFFDLVYAAKVAGQGEDKLCWKLANPKRFEVRLYYRALVPCVGNFPWKSIWQGKVPPRVDFFAWTAYLGRVLTANNLRRWKIILMSWCCMCKVDGKSVNHLFLHYTIAQGLWFMVFSLFGIHWVIPRRVMDLLACWQGRLGRHRNRLFGVLSLIVCCGAYGGKEVLRLLREVNGTF